MSTLLLRLAGPMQSWGTDSKFDVRRTGREPSKSGVIGLVAAALGIARQDRQALQTLNGLRFGVRVDREGALLRDFHTARPEKGTPYVTYRYYLSDAEFVAGLESDDRALLARIAQALQAPAFPLYLGRRSCPPVGRVFLKISDEPLEAALRAGVRYALDVYPHYSSDADVAVCAGNDVRHCVVGAGVYASHGYERSHIEGLANTFDLLNSYIETAD